MDKQWGVVELFGRQRICGELSEQSVAGVVMLRVDVPKCGKNEAYTRLFTAGAIYGIIAPISEDQAMTFINHYNPSPISEMLRELEEREKRTMLDAGDDRDDELQY